MLANLPMPHDNNVNHPIHSAVSMQRLEAQGGRDISSLLVLPDLSTHCTLELMCKAPMCD